MTIFRVTIQLRGSGLTIRPTVPARTEHLAAWIACRFADGFVRHVEPEMPLLANLEAEEEFRLVTQSL